MSLFRVAALSSVVALLGCAQQKAWVKPGATPDDFSRARYACLQQTQQPYSTAFVGRYGGSASGGMTTNVGLFNACMDADGWTLVDNPATSGSAPYSDAIKVIQEEARAMCSRADLQLYYAWSPCNVRQTTAEQLANRSKITTAEKPIFLKVRAEIDSINARIAAANREHNSKNGAALATNIERWSAAGGRVAQDYYEGRITRGEYNRRRQELMIQSDAEAHRILRGR